MSVRHNHPFNMILIILLCFFDLVTWIGFSFPACQAGEAESEAFKQLRPFTTLTLCLS